MTNNFYEIHQPRISKAQVLIRWADFTRIRKKVYDKYNAEGWFYEIDEEVLIEFINELLNYYKRKQ